MALPDQLNATVPPDVGEAVSLGPSRIRALASIFADFFGIPVAPQTLTAQATSITTGGVISITQPGATVAADPTAALGIASKQYVDKASPKVAAAVRGAADAYTVSNTIPLTALYHGFTQVIIPTLGNATGTPTLNIDGTGAFPLVVDSGQNPGVNMVQGGIPFLVMFNSSINSYQILNQIAYGFFGLPLSSGPTITGQVYQYNGTNFAPAQVGPPSQSVVVTTTLVNNSIGAAGNAVLYQIACNAPSAVTYPGLTWRPVVSFAAYAQPHTNGTNTEFSAVLTSSAAFTTIGNAANVFGTQSAHTIGCTGLCWGLTPLASGSASTFTLTGYAPQNALDVVSAPDGTSGTQGGISVYWVQAV